MCREILLIFPQCGHPKSSIGTIYHCPSYASRGRTCVNTYGQTYKDYELHFEDARSRHCFVKHDFPIKGDLKAEIAQGYKGYCHHCVEGRLVPMEKSDMKEFLNGYLGEHERWTKEKEKREKLAVEQERLIERLKKEKGENEWWTEAD
jgi:hypothetical protein